MEGDRCVKTRQRRRRHRRREHDVVQRDRRRAWARALTGGPNVDILDGGPGADVLVGGGGLDRATYGNHTAPVTVTLDDIANDGEAGEADNVRSDVEDVIGSPLSDTLTGNGSASRLYGGAGADVLNGLGGDDTLTEGRGPDTESGGDGQDTFEQASSADRGDVFNGGAGSADRISYARRAAAVVVDLDGTDDDGVVGEHDNVQTDVEQVVGGHADDSLTGSAAANLLLGGPGNDTLNGLAGADALVGEAGDDTLLGGAGNDTLTSVDGVLGNDRLDGQADSDSRSFDRFDAWANCEALAIFP
jgi:Ca2+-binding RTX toxin-like protein